MTAIKKILAPTDFSELSLHALDETAGFAAKLGAEIHLVHVCPVLMYAIAPGATPEAPNFEESLKQRLTTQLEELAARLRKQGVTVTTALVDGNPNRAISDVAAEHGCDLIAIGSHGRSGLERLTLGSVAERTIRSSHVPVLTLRPAQQH